MVGWTTCFQWSGKKCFFKCILKIEPLSFPDENFPSLLAMTVIHTSQKQLQGRISLVWTCMSLFIIKRSQGRNKSRSKNGIVEESCLDRFLSLIFYKIQDHTPKAVTAHSDLGCNMPLTNQEDALDQHDGDIFSTEIPHPIWPSVMPIW